MKKESLAGRFLECAGRFPERTAIVHQSHAITYAELKRNAQRLAHYLVDQYHIEPEQLVGIHGLRSIDSITAMLAAMLAGGGVCAHPGGLAGAAQTRDHHGCTHGFSAECGLIRGG